MPTGSSRSGGILFNGSCKQRGDLLADPSVRRRIQPPVFDVGLDAGGAAAIDEGAVGASGAGAAALACAAWFEACVTLRMNRKAGKTTMPFPSTLVTSSLLFKTLRRIRTSLFDVLNRMLVK